MAMASSAKTASIRISLMSIFVIKSSWFGGRSHRLRK
jgi:hypothetical protein